MIDQLKFKVKNAPQNPGVYLFKDKKNEIIYVGKAKNLTKRVVSYFNSPKEAKTQALVSNISDVDFIITDNELEALILENNLIKKYSPTYNIEFKDGKSYPYLAITLSDKYPRLLITREEHKKGTKYYGPFTNARALRSTLDTLRKIFPVRTCKTIKPGPACRQAGKINGRPCLNYHIDRCLGPCSNNVDPKEYRLIIDQIIDFLEGRGEKIIKILTNQMNVASQNMQYEQAAKIRNRIIAAKSVLDKQKMVDLSQDDQDIIGKSVDHDLITVEIFNIRNGKLLGNHDFLFQKGAESDYLGSFIKQYYTRAGFIPKELVLPSEIEDKELLEKWLSDMAKAKVKITIPQRGRKKRLINLASKNARHYMELSKKSLQIETKRALEGLKELSEILNIGLPSRIECFDISNTSGTNSVGSMVVFIDGKPKKDHYRRFKIRKVDGPNDFEMMKEVIERRFKNFKSSVNPSFKEKPDVIIVDGGAPQLSAALSVLQAFNLNIPVGGLAKKNEELYLPYKDPLLLIPGSKVLLLLQQLRDEAHRFAVTYHRNLRSKNLKASKLNGIIGLGAKRKSLLLKKFGTVEKIKNSSIEDLIQVEGIGKQTAKAILSYLNIKPIENKSEEYKWTK